MEIAFFDTHRYEREVFERFSQNSSQEITYFSSKLTEQTANLAQGKDVVCCFVNDSLDRKTLTKISKLGVKLIALRCAGFNNVDLEAAEKLGMVVARVPEYSPYAVAEHASALILALNRKIHRAYHRVRDLNFSLEGMVGFDLHGKTVGILGTGKIGSVFAKIMHGYGCKLLAFDLKRNPQLQKKYELQYTSLDNIYQKADIISLHLPLTPQTRHIIDHDSFEKMKAGAMLINTGRGALINSRALLNALKSEKLGYAGLDVYEEEGDIFFRDLSEQVLHDDCLARLLTFPNVLITSHQAFLTKEALNNIAQTTLKNIVAFEEGTPLKNQVYPEKHLR